MEAGSRRGLEEGVGQGMMEKGAGYEDIDHKTIIAHLFYLSKDFTLNFSSGVQVTAPGTAANR